MGLVERSRPRREAGWEFLFALALAAEGVDLVEEQLDVAHAGDAALWKHNNPKVHPCIRRGVESRVIGIRVRVRVRVRWKYDNPKVHPCAAIRQAGSRIEGYCLIGRSEV